MRSSVSRSKVRAASQINCGYYSQKLTIGDRSVSSSNYKPNSRLIPRSVVIMLKPLGFAAGAGTSTQWDAGIRRNRITSMPYSSCESRFVMRVQMQVAAVICA